MSTLCKFYNSHELIRTNFDKKYEQYAQIPLFVISHSILPEHNSQINCK